MEGEMMNQRTMLSEIADYYHDLANHYAKIGDTKKMHQCQIAGLQLDHEIDEHGDRPARSIHHAH